MALNIFGQPPEYLSGLLGIDPEKLRKQAFGTGLVNTALAFAAQPRNQGYGSALPYAARALMAGQQGAQGVYQDALQGYMTKQQIEQLKRQQEQQQAQQEYVNQFATERPELASAIKAYPQLIPDIVKGQISPEKPQYMNVDGQVVKIDGGGATPIFGGQKPSTEVGKLIAERDKYEPGTPNYNFYSNAIKKATEFAPTAPAAVINVGQKKYTEELAGGLAKQDLDMINIARTAPNIVSRSDRVIELLDKTPITGAGANQLLQLNTALAKAGLIDPSSGATTQSLASELAATTLDNIKSSGLGAGQGFTDKDREFLERAKAGQITMEPQAIRRLAELNKQSATASIDKYNKYLESLTDEEKQTLRLQPITTPRKGKLIKLQ
jgi:hypothetical protein